MNITQLECLCLWPYASSKQCAYAILSSVACSTLQYFSTFSHKRHDFWKTLLITKWMFWYSLQHLSETFLILKRNWRYMIKIYIGLHVKYPLCLFDFIETCIFTTDFRKTLKYQISWNFFQWKLSCFMRTDGRTDWRIDRQADMTKLIDAFRNFANAPKKLRRRQDDVV
jgi:hypothetical protein